MGRKKTEREFVVVMRDPKTLTPDPRNARTHSAEQVEQLRASYREFGFTNPILLKPSGMIGAGHGRHLMALAENIAQVPTITLNLTPKQWQAYAIADNQLAMNAGWNVELLKAELEAIDAAGFNIPALIGFSADELAELDVSGFTIDQKTAAEEATPPVEPAISRRGDLWILGDHRVLCGDATAKVDVERLLAGAKPHLMVTDPPYGVDYDARWRLDKGLNKIHQKRAAGRVQNDTTVDWREAWALFAGDVAYVWHASYFISTTQASLEAAKFRMRSQIIWFKPSLVIGRGDYHSQHEPCWYAVRLQKTGHWSGGRKQSNVWQIANMHATQGSTDDGKTSHSTQKPVECMRRPILNNSRKGDAVYDPFLGSGTTIIAAQTEGRKCYGLEIEPAFVDVIVRRWEKFTGGTAQLEDGSTLAELTAKRAGKKSKTGVKSASRTLETANGKRDRAEASG
jgi:DNA modification methylase